MRPTKDITVGEHTFKVKTYVSAREANAIQQVYLSAAKIEVQGEQPKFTEFDPTVQMRVQEELVRQIVLEMDGSTDQVVDRCLDLPSYEYEDLVAQLDDLTAKKKQS